MVDLSRHLEIRQMQKAAACQCVAEEGLEAEGDLEVEEVAHNQGQDLSQMEIMVAVMRHKMEILLMFLFGMKMSTVCSLFVLSLSLSLCSIDLTVSNLFAAKGHQSNTYWSSDIIQGRLMMKLHSSASCFAYKRSNDMTLLSHYLVFIQW